MEIKIGTGMLVVEVRFILVGEVAIKILCDLFFDFLDLILILIFLICAFSRGCPEFNSMCEDIDMVVGGTSHLLVLGRNGILCSSGASEFGNLGQGGIGDRVDLTPVPALRYSSSSLKKGHYWSQPKSRRKDLP